MIESYIKTRSLCNTIFQVPEQYSKNRLISTSLELVYNIGESWENVSEIENTDVSWYEEYLKKINQENIPKNLNPLKPSFEVINTFKRNTSPIKEISENRENNSESSKTKFQSISSKVPSPVVDKKALQFLDNLPDLSYLVIPTHELQ
jgi:hypothetical protein